MRYEVITNVTEIANNLILRAGEFTMFAVIIIGGDRVRVCDEAVIAYDQPDTVVGMATISPRGEDGSGQPEIVGTFVLPEEGKQGVGLELIKRALERCAERGFMKVRITPVTKMGRRLVNRLPADLPVEIVVNDQSHLSPF